MAVPDPVPERHLRLVDQSTGEVFSVTPGCANCDRLASELGEAHLHIEAKKDLEQQLADANVDLAKYRAHVRRLQDQLTKDLQEFERAPLIDALFELWQRLCNHPRSYMDKDRADKIRKILMLKRPDGTSPTEREARMAILGAARSPFVSPGVGGAKRHDGLDLIFRNAEKFEDFANRGARWLREHPEDAPWVEPKCEALVTKPLKTRKS